MIRLIFSRESLDYNLSGNRTLKVKKITRQKGLL